MVEEHKVWYSVRQETNLVSKQTYINTQVLTYSLQKTDHLKDMLTLLLKQQQYFLV